MDVLHIVESAGGGVARHIEDLCIGLIQKDVGIHIVYSPIREDDIFRAAIKRLQSAGASLISIPMQRAPHASDIQVIREIQKYIKYNKSIKIVHGHSSKGGVYARLARIGTRLHSVYSPHGFVPWLPQPQRALYITLERAMRFATSAIIVVSEKEMQFARRLGYPKELIHLVPNGISLDGKAGASRTKARQLLNLSPHDKVIGFVGRFASPKSPLLLIDAFAIIAHDHPNAKLVMVGTGPLLPLAKGRARSLSLQDRILFPGYMDGRDAMAAFDLFALTSEYEGFPYVILEAMAYGLPIVATNVGGTELAIFDNENGYVVQVGDVGGFAEKLNLLLSNDALRLEMGAESLKKVNNFSIDNMVNITLRIYRQWL